LANGDIAGWRQACSDVTREHSNTEDHEDADLIAWTCSLAPEALPDWLPILRLAERSVQSNSSAFYLVTLGAVYLRMGQLQKAIDTMHQVIALDSDDTFTEVPFLLAIAYQKQGQAQEARGWLDEARRRLQEELPSEREWFRVLERILLQKEAE